MKQLTLFHFEACPYCREAIRWMDELKKEHPELQAVHVEMVDERKEPERLEQYTRRGFSYYYVPTFYLGDEKVHEGAASKLIIEKVLRKALAS